MVAPTQFFVPEQLLTALTLDKLCRYFGCKLDQLAEYIPDNEAP